MSTHGRGLRNLTILALVVFAGGSLAQSVLAQAKRASRFDPFNPALSLGPVSGGGGSGGGTQAPAAIIPPRPIDPTTGGTVGGPPRSYIIRDPFRMPVRSPTRP